MEGGRGAGRRGRGGAAGGEVGAVAAAGGGGAAEEGDERGVGVVVSLPVFGGGLVWGVWGVGIGGWRSVLGVCDGRLVVVERTRVWGESGQTRIHITPTPHACTHRMAMRMRSSLTSGGACPLALISWKAGSTKSASKSSEMVASGLVKGFWLFGVGGWGWVSGCVVASGLVGVCCFWLALVVGIGGLGFAIVGGGNGHTHSNNPINQSCMSINHLESGELAGMSWLFLPPPPPPPLFRCPPPAGMGTGPEAATCGWHMWLT